jgi:hypothetical protein
MTRVRIGKRGRMTALAVTIIAQHSQNAPSSGTGAGLIIGTVVAVVVALALIWFVISRMAKRSRGGVEPVAEERRRGNPPVEGVERGG